MSIYLHKGARPAQHTVEFKDTIVVLDYPSKTTWSAEIFLEEGRFDYEYKFISPAGVSSPWKSVQSKIVYSEPEQKRLNNDLDAWGVLFDTPRHLSETNGDYKERLLDVFIHKGGFTYDKLVNGICRDLDLDYHDQAMVINAKESSSTGQCFEDILITVTTRYIKIHTPDFIAEQTVIPDQYNNIRLDRDLYNIVYIKDENDLDIEYSVSSNPDTITLTDNLKKVYVKYLFWLKVDLFGKTLADVETELEAIKNDYGDYLLDVSVKADYASEDAYLLNRIIHTTLKDKHLDVKSEEALGLPLKWTEVKIIPICDDEYIESQKSVDGSLYDSKYLEYYKTLVRQSKQFWGSAVLDSSLVGSAKVPLYGTQYLITIPDANLTGLKNKRFLSGVGHDLDLLLNIGYDRITSEFKLRHHIIMDSSNPSKDDLPLET